MDDTLNESNFFRGLSGAVFLEFPTAENVGQDLNP